MLQFKGQGFLGPPLILSLSGSNLMAQDEINAAWPPEGLLTPVCLSPVQGRAVYLWCGPSALWARLGTDQFNLDYTQNKLDLASSGHLLPSWMIVDRLVCMMFLLCKELQSSKQSIVNNTSFILLQTLSCHMGDMYFFWRSIAIPHFHKLVLWSLLDYYYDFFYCCSIVIICSELNQIIYNNKTVKRGLKHIQTFITRSALIPYLLPTLFSDWPHPHNKNLTR